MFSFRACLIILAGLVFSTKGWAVEPTDIRLKMIHGDYASAFVEAEDLETADGYALAAEILLTEIMLGQAEKNKKQAKRARKLAKAGLEIAPSHQNARLQYAIADGFVTRETGDVSAWMKKLPQKTHDKVQAYRTDFPSDPRGDALLGAWHLAIARKAGDKNAQKWFDASIAQGRELFQSARQARPQDIVINMNYAFSLLALDAEDFSDKSEASQILTEIVARAPADHLERVLQDYAQAALDQIEDADRVRDYAGMFLDGEVPVFEVED